MKVRYNVLPFLRAVPGFACLFLACFTLSARALEARELAVVVNTQDPLSVQIGEYYAQRRGILFQNYIKVSFAPGASALTRDAFARIKAEVDGKTQPNVQAYALTWAAPYRVECMSITAAFAFGFDPAYCADGCKATRASSYFNATTREPFAQMHLRPTMAIAASSFEQAKALIDRGVDSDGTQPSGTAYLLSTADRTRDVRSTLYGEATRVLKPRVKVEQLREEALRDKRDVLFYFIGRASVDALDTLAFVPGAVADHLTSAGGALTDSSQMSALRWLEAGATGSYGAVVEPCNLLQKFPHPAVLAAHYLRGETLIESYWKSVLMPGQGIFIGEPLAAPFRVTAH